MQVAACLIVKNEERYLAEWLAYHCDEVFDTVIIYDNNSTDRTSQIAKAFSRRFDVRLVPWPSTAYLTWQIEAYQDALTRFGPEFEWMCFLDADEFVRTARGLSFKGILTGLQRAHATALPWRLFGSSGHLTAPEGLVLAAYQHHAPADFGPNRHVKSVVRPSCVEAPINAHCFHIKGYPDPRTAPQPTGYTWPNGKEVIWAQGTQGISSELPDTSRWWLNHYFVKSEAEWSIKVNRGYNGERRADEEFQLYDRNEIFSSIDKDQIERVLKNIKLSKYYGVASSLMGRIGLSKVGPTGLTRR